MHRLLLLTIPKFKKVMTHIYDITFLFKRTLFVIVNNDIASSSILDYFKIIEIDFNDAK